MKSISIRTNLLVIIVLSLVPVGLLGVLFLNRTQSEIAFSANEVEGTMYLSAIYPDFAGLWDAAAPGRLSARDDATNAAKRWAVAMKTEKAQADYESARNGADTTQALGALGTLVARIADGSNLILDPALDSYYVMDVVVIRLPGLWQSAARVRDLGGELAAGGDQARIALAAELLNLRSLLGTLEDSVKAASAANADGSVGASLRAPLEGVLAAGSDFAAKLEHDGKAGLAAATLARALSTMADAALVRLKALLDSRVEAMSKTYLSIAGAGLLVLGLVGFCLVTMRSILRSLRRLETDVRAFADGTSEAVSTAGQREIARLAQAVVYLRDRVIARSADAEAARQAERDRADEVHAAAEVQRREADAARAAHTSELQKVVAAMSESLSRLAGGDLTARIETAFAADFEGLRGAFNDTIGRLAGSFGQLRSLSGKLRGATMELGTGAGDLVDRTSRQAAAIEETSAALEQLSGAVGGNAERADHADKRSLTVTREADEVGQAMRQSNEAMERISASARKISNIVGLIDDIAFQTNLLALNASVEAARAGETGKGFAVVAQEVRRLAQSAAQASADIKGLIEESAGEVDQGSRLVARASERLGTMLEGLKENLALVREIAQATRDQSISISEISTALRQMDEMTQQNAVLVERTNVAVGEAESQAGVLDQVVGGFRLLEAAAPAEAPPPSKPNTRGATPLKAARTRYMAQGNAALDWQEF